MRTAFRTPFAAVFAASRSAAVVPRAVSGRQFLFAQQQRAYSASGGLSKQDIQTRVLDVLKSFEKVKPELLTTSASFDKDLGLDSLDAVEVVMAVEEEFSIEIPDAEADAITTVQEAIDYISKTPAAH